MAFRSRIVSCFVSGGRFHMEEADHTRLPLNKDGYINSANAIRALERYYVIEATDFEYEFRLLRVRDSHKRIAPRDLAFVDRMIDHELDEEAKAKRLDDIRRDADAVAPALDFEAPAVEAPATFAEVLPVPMTDPVVAHVVAADAATVEAPAIERAVAADLAARREERHGRLLDGIALQVFPARGLRDLDGFVSDYGHIASADIMARVQTLREHFTACTRQPAEPIDGNTAAVEILPVPADAFETTSAHVEAVIAANLDLPVITTLPPRTAGRRNWYADLNPHRGQRGEKPWRVFWRDADGLHMTAIRGSRRKCERWAASANQSDKAASVAPAVETAPTGNVEAPALHLYHGQPVRLPGWNHVTFATVGSAEGYARDNGDNVETTLRRCRERRDEIAWATYTGGALVADGGAYHERQRKIVEAAKTIDVGTIVEIEGRRYSVTVDALSQKHPRYSNPIKFHPL